MSGKGKGTPPGKGAPSGNKSPGSIGSQFAFSSKAMNASKPKQSKVEATQTKFLALLDALNDDELEEFRDFVREELDFAPEEPEFDEEMMAALALSAKEGANDGDEKLVDIIHFLRKALPTSALAPNETMTIPKGDHYEGYTEQNTVHVDEFLYTDEEAEELKDAGLLTHDYCADCGSRNLKPLNYISHSLPREVTRWLFAAALPNITGKTLVDVGSRLGPVLWMGYLFSHASKLIGIELNKTFAELAQQIVTTNKFADRVSIVNDNVLNQGEVLKTADVVVLNNVFEWFSDHQELKKLWDFVSSAISKKGCIVVTCPSIEESLAQAGISDIDITKWVKKMEVRYPTPPAHHHDHDHAEGEHCEDEEDEDPFFESVREVHLYEVI